MTARRSTPLLAGLLVATLLAGALVGVGAASHAEGSGAGVHNPTAVDAAAVDAIDRSRSVQSTDNGTEARSNTTIVHDGGAVTLANSESEAIRGETDLRQGTRLYVQVASEDPESPFMDSAETYVTDDGTFSARVDLSAVPANTSAEVQVRNESVTLATAPGEIVRCTDDCLSPDEWPELKRGVVDGARGEELDVVVEVPDAVNGSVNVTIGDEDSSFVVEAATVDADEDGEIVLTLNTTSAGNGSPSEYLSTDGDEILAAHQPTRELDWALEAGNYDLAVGPRDAPYDVGTMAISERELEEDDESTRANVSAETTGEVTFVTAGDRLELGNAANRTISAETELPPGTKVGLRITSQDAEDPFLYTLETTVTEYGTINATVDLSEVSPGTPFEVIAHHDGKARGATLGRVVECDEGCQQETNAGSQAAVGEASDGATNGTNQNGSSSVVAAEGGDGGSFPVEGLAAIGVGGLLSLLALARFTGLLKR